MKNKNGQVFIAAISFAAIIASIAIFKKQTSLPVYQKYNTILGFNGNLSSNPVDYLDINFLNAVDSLYPEGMRWPGGTVANTFNWRTDKPSLLSLKSLVNRTHCKMFIVLNMITKDLNDQLQMLDSAHKLGVFTDTVFIEMGNEFNTASRDQMYSKYASPAEYAQEAARWIIAIKKLYVKAKFLIPAGNVNGKYFKDWNEQIIKAMTANSITDFGLVWHYHNPQPYVLNGIVDTALVSRLMDEAKTTMFGSFPVSRIYITEFNLRNETNGTSVVFKDDYQQGLAATFMMEKFCKIGVGACLFHNIVGAENNGAIISTKKESYLSPTGKAIAEFIKRKEASDTIPLNDTIKPVDTVLRTGIGIYPAEFQQSYNARIGRRVVSATDWRTGIAYTDTILLNITNNWQHIYAYTIDTAIFAAKCIKIYNTLKPELVVIENEELLHGDVKDYCNELTAAANLLKDKVTNGGLTTKELGFWYWYVTRDTAFFKYNIVHKDSLAAGYYNRTIENVGYELSVLKALPIKYWNVHYYIWYEGQPDGLIRMINYVSNYLGKPAISNEAGVYSNIGLLNSCVNIAKQTKMKYLILYSGSGATGKPMPISQNDFLNISHE